MGRLGHTVRAEEARAVPPHPPPSLASQSWVDQFNEERDCGSAISSVRDAEQTAIARFWTPNVIRQFNRLGRDLASNPSLDLPQTARLLAMINVVDADAQIAVMYWKYQFLFWRPVTAIDQLAVTVDGFGPVPGFDDGYGDAIEEAGWCPLLTTPNHPEYPGAHGSMVDPLITARLQPDRERHAIDVDLMRAYAAPEAQALANAECGMKFEFLNWFRIPHSAFRIIRRPVDRRA